MNYVADMADRIRREVPEGLVPEEDSEALFTLYAILALTVGEAVTCREVHDAWTAWMTLRGEQHPAMVPFALLDVATQAEDQPFVDAISRALQGRRT